MGTFYLSMTAPYLNRNKTRNRINRRLRNGLVLVPHEVIQIFENVSPILKGTLDGRLDRRRFAMRF
jgi:hypothetical protein